jgi:hypothetical protein
MEAPGELGRTGNLGKGSCAVMQPTFIPWIGYFDLIDQVDKFVFLDDVQVEKSSWQVRNRIKTPQGELFLTISRKKNKGQELSLIKDTKIDEGANWREKHIKTIEIAYKRAEFFDEVFPFINPLIMNDITNLSSFNINIIKSICKRIGIKKEFLLSSELQDISGIKDQRVVGICKSIGCHTYLSPSGAAGYINKDSAGGEFVKQGVTLFYHNYRPAVYKQLYGEFLPYMSIIDLLFNEGFEKSLEIIRKGRGNPIDPASFNGI